MEKIRHASIGVFGGSGFYSFLEKKDEFWMDTPYGSPSERIIIGELEGIDVAFLPRHGRAHTIPPHRINYQANMYAMKMLGVRSIIGPCAAGSLSPDVKPRDFVVCDQFVDRTNGRKDTYYDGPRTTHISMADPYCKCLREILIETAKEVGITCHGKGTVVVVQGPRFSTRAESRWYSSQGWEVINMTQYPECYLARELEMCYANISLITDYDVGLEDDPHIKPVSTEEVVKVFHENNDRLRTLLFQAIPKIRENKECGCQQTLRGARINE